jgi:hypothetical protein
MQLTPTRGFHRSGAQGRVSRSLHGPERCLRALATLLALAVCAACASTTAPPGPPVFYPAPPETPRVQYLRSYSSDQDVVKLSGFRNFVMGDPEFSRIGKVYGFALHEGKLFVCDTDRRYVVIFDLVAGTVGLMGQRSLQKPVNITIGRDGTRYVADTNLRRVMVYDANNRYVKSLGDRDQWDPADVALFEDRLYVADMKEGQVVVLDPKSGEELRRFGRLGNPTNLDLDRDGNVYVTETLNATVSKFNSRGRRIQQFGSLGRMLGQFVRPKGIAVDRRDRIWVVDAAFENVQVFDPEGALLLVFGTAGNMAGGLNLPATISIDYDNVELFADYVAPGYAAEFLVLVSSQYGRNRINVYAFLRESEPGRDRTD